jgi:hypothetical protein
MGPGDENSEQPSTTGNSSDNEPVQDVPAPAPEYVENGYKGPRRGVVTEKD